jgi:hypothetical protein
MTYKSHSGRRKDCAAKRKRASKLLLANPVLIARHAMWRQK